jgi:hypothetical protein
MLAAAVLAVLNGGAFTKHLAPESPRKVIAANDFLLSLRLTGALQRLVTSTSWPP